MNDSEKLEERIANLEKRVENLEVTIVGIAMYIQELLPRGRGREDPGPTKNDLDYLMSIFFDTSTDLGGFKDKRIKKDD